MFAWHAALALVAAMILPPGARAADAGRAALELGLEQVGVSARGDSQIVAFENRRYRHSAEALGRLSAACGPGVVFRERRLGLESAAFTWGPTRGGWIERMLGAATDSTLTVRYPSDDPFWMPVGGTTARPLSRSLDIQIGPRINYEFGRLLDPFVWSLELEPRVAYSPWPGAHLSASWIIPIHDDFEPTELQPDQGRSRPGPVNIEQFAWIPGLALGSLNAGYFGRNRYGVSAGVARPIDGGRWWLDAQADLTGFVSFTQGDILYSTPSLGTGFAGLTWRAPVYDLALRGRAQWFLYGDRGVELQVRREIGDLGVAFYYQRIEGNGYHGVRLDVPIPPMVRSTEAAVRVQPVPRFPFTYNDRNSAVGTALAGVASREDYLRQLDDPALAANVSRFRAARAGGSAPRHPGDAAWISLAGMSGFVNTPWAGTVGDRELALGYSSIPRAWAYDHRDEHANAYYYGTLGFLPFAEVQLRWTQIVGLRDFEAIVPDSRLADIDRTASARLRLLEPRPGRPGLAVGVDDLVGTRRFHSSYLVSGLPGRILGMQTRVAIGYAPRAFEAPRHVLDGGFGAAEIQPWRFLRIQAEYDSEKWNLGLGVAPGFGLQLRVAALDLESLSAGAGWSWPL
jgi:Exopolysaccharide biosynthesis protein YbjH